MSFAPVLRSTSLAITSVPAEIPRHRQVDKYGVERHAVAQRSVDGLERAAAVTDDHTVVTEHGKRPIHHATNICVVVDHKDSLPPSTELARRSILAQARLALQSWQVHGELRSTTERRADTDVAAVLFDYRVDGRQTDSAARGLRREVWIEDAWQVLRRDAAALIAHTDPHVRAWRER